MLVVAVTGRRVTSLLEAVAAVDGLVATWEERDFSRQTAVGASRRVHLAWTRRVTASSTATTGGRVSASASSTATVAARVIAATTTTAALRFSRLTASWATLWFGKATLLVECLLARRKGELLTAIAARERPVAHSA
jgi:hypothetical protein